MVSEEAMQNIVVKFEKAYNKLQGALSREYDKYIRDSAIRRFEFTFELLSVPAFRTGLGGHSK
ncbi:MAG: nucleotidyltransferase substrate binding protein [Clostridia bacterium]|nr:nucleotidyltransferase substrate binding protein [Clostridia bacterium]